MISFWRDDSLKVFTAHFQCFDYHYYTFDIYFGIGPKIRWTFYRLTTSTFGNGTMVHHIFVTSNRLTKKHSSGNSQWAAATSVPHAETRVALSLQVLLHKCRLMKTWSLLKSKCYAAVTKYASFRSYRYGAKMWRSRMKRIFSAAMHLLVAT